MTKVKWICPECGCTLSHDRVDDGIVSHSITANGTVTETYNDSNGYDSVYCSNDSSHEIPDELINKVLYLIDDQTN